MTNPPLTKLWTKMLMKEKGGERLGPTYSRGEDEGHEKPNSNFKTLVRHLPNHGGHLFSIFIDVKIRNKMFTKAEGGFFRH